MDQISAALNCEKYLNKKQNYLSIHLANNVLLFLLRHAVLIVHYSVHIYSDFELRFELCRVVLVVLLGRHDGCECEGLDVGLDPRGLRSGREEHRGRVVLEVQSAVAELRVSRDKVFERLGLDLVLGQTLANDCHPKYSHRQVERLVVADCGVVSANACQS